MLEGVTDTGQRRRRRRRGKSSEGDGQKLKGEKKRELSPKAGGRGGDERNRKPLMAEGEER